ncbi:extracellular solute-binding protein [Paenibacillus sp. JCM 10914]|uniref:extracellular solute-binding protein n=1 Tax=Paenibacillus sp. JCM 10914 TaxID=1236974 RepID=UPI0003CCAE5B|nr:extracellular solute-binding protein [Paenibacillus sp. JCM 10914]GAE05915.1 extracellular solute-binding protein, family 1 [Paenibacillus sp. JCM 10914]
MKRRTNMVIALTMAGMLALSACGGGSSNNGSTAAPESPPSSTEQPVDLSGKYEPPIEVSAWRYTESTYKYENGDSIGSNIYTKAYQEELGIHLNYKWTVPIEQFEQKMNVSIASGDLPDIMWLTNKQLTDLADNDMLYDLTDLYEQYATPLAKEILQQDQKAFDTAKINGRLMAIPKTASAVDGLPILHVRTDWLEKLSLPEPKTMQDLVDIAKAFVTQDPDGNNQADTIGLGLTKTFLTDNHFGTAGFFAGFHAYPQKWTTDDSGKLVYGSIQPGVKEGLQWLQDMYKEGLLDMEFGVKDRAKVTESVASGKLGMFYGGMSSPGAVIQDNATNDPNAEWKAFALVSADEVKAMPMGKVPVQLYYAVSKKSKHPEAIMKLLNFSMEGFAPDAPADTGFGFSPSGLPVYLYNFIGPEPAMKNLNAHRNVLTALESNDPSSLSSEEKTYYDKIVDHRAGNRENWGQDRIFGTPSSFDVIEQYVDEDNYQLDGFYGGSTPTMVEKFASLQKLEEEVFTNIIMGQSIDSFDKFTEDWMKLGGEQITNEVNEWASKL